MAISKIVQDSIDSASTGVCRAWVNFNGTGTVAIRASFNVSSITDNGTGDYTVNFTTAMPDVNYSFHSSVGMSDSGDASTSGIGLRMSPYPGTGSASYTMSTTAIRLQVKYANYVASGVNDSEVVAVSFFR